MAVPIFVPSVRLVDTISRPWLARVVGVTDSSPLSLERLVLNSWDVYEEPVPVTEGLSVGSSPTLPLEVSLSADKPIPEAMKSPRPYVLVGETSFSVAIDNVLLTSLDESEVLSPVAVVVLRYDALETVSFCVEDAEANVQLNNTRSTSERAGVPKQTSAITIEARTKRRWTRNQTKERLGSEAAVDQDSQASETATPEPNNKA